MGSPSCTGVALTGNPFCFKHGVVVQLVRIPACHAGGRGFESRPLRQQFWALPREGPCLLQSPAPCGLQWQAAFSVWPSPPSMVPSSEAFLCRPIGQSPFAGQVIEKARQTGPSNSTRTAFSQACSAICAALLSRTGAGSAATGGSHSGPVDDRRQECGAQYLAPGRPDRLRAAHRIDRLFPRQRLPQDPRSDPR